jgi:hypothetical protein
MSDIFISYAREDRHVAATLATILAAYGFVTWWDRDLLSGIDYEQEIARQLETAKAVIVLWSATSTKSGWVRDEAAAAVARGVLVPVMLDGATPPLGFRSLHAISLDPDDPAELLRAVTRLIATPTHPPAFLPPPRRPAIPWIELTVATVIVAALVILLRRILS